MPLGLKTTHTTGTKKAEAVSLGLQWETDFPAPLNWSLSA